MLKCCICDTWFHEPHTNILLLWLTQTPEEYSEHRTVDHNVKDSMLKSLDDLVCVGILRFTHLMICVNSLVIDPGYLILCPSKIQIHTFESVAEKEDCHGFVDLLKLLLCVNGNKRISASEALNHPFITMSHLMEPRYQNQYVIERLGTSQNLHKCQTSYFIFVIYSFNDVRRFMRCCTGMRLTGDRIQDENKDKINSTEQTKVQQRNKKDNQELKSQERQTQKKNAWNTCKLPIDSDSQEPEDGSKTNNCSAPSSFLQFGKEFMACFTCGQHSSSQRTDPHIKNVSFQPEQQLPAFKINIKAKIKIKFTFKVNGFMTNVASAKHTRTKMDAMTPEFLL